MKPQPVLVVHGVANRSRENFQQQVKTLAEGLGGGFELIPAWWGDRGAPSEHIGLTIPQPDGFETRAGDLAGTAADDEVEMLLTALDAHRGRHETRSARDERNKLRKEIAEVWSEIPRPPRGWSEADLQAIGAGLSAAIAAPEDKRKYETRGGTSLRKGLIRSVLQGITSAWTAFKGTALGGAQQTVRHEFMPLIAEFLGDIIVYQRHQQEIHDLVRAALAGYVQEKGLGDQQLGSPDNPLPVIGHSLGGVISFDLAAAARPALHISKLVTLGSQPSFFHLCDPRDDQDPPRVAPFGGQTKVPLPTTIGKWRNFWEPLDTFAFIAGNVFSGNVADIPLQHLRSSGLYTHSDYWAHDEVHREVRMFLE